MVPLKLLIGISFAVMGTYEIWILLSFSAKLFDGKLKFIRIRMCNYCNSISSHCTVVFKDDHAMVVIAMMAKNDI